MSRIGTDNGSAPSTSPALSRWKSWRQAFRQWRATTRARRKEAEFAERARTFEQRYSHLQLGTAPPLDRPLRFSHGGNAGDLIFSLPALRAISADAPAHLLLELGRPAFYDDGQHPLGNVRLNRTIFEMLKPLLEAQSYIQTCDVMASGEAVDYALDFFRDAPLPGDKGYLARWCFYVYGVNYDLSQAWLTAPRDAGLNDALVIARSQRYRNPVLDYGFLARYPRLLFVGVDAEFAELRERLPRLEHVRVADFLQMAGIIASCRLFVGNQSLPFALAEALKVPRVLEISPRAPNVIPEGPNGYDCYFQRQFEFVIAHCME
jgi:hypothetical protein